MFEILKMQFVLWMEPQYVESVREWSMQLERLDQSLGIVVEVAAAVVGPLQHAMVEVVVVAGAMEVVDHHGAHSILAIVALCVENAVIIHTIVLSLVVVVVQALERREHHRGHVPVLVDAKLATAEALQGQGHAHQGEALPEIVTPTKEAPTSVLLRA
jgi:hypothetical protein